MKKENTVLALSVLGTFAIELAISLFIDSFLYHFENSYIAYRLIPATINLAFTFINYSLILPVILSKFSVDGNKAFKVFFVFNIVLLVISILGTLVFIYLIYASPTFLAVNELYELVTYKMQIDIDTPAIIEMLPNLLFIVALILLTVIKPLILKCVLKKL